MNIYAIFDFFQILHQTASLHFNTVINNSN